MKGREGLGKNSEILCRRNWKSGEAGSVSGVDHVSVGVESQFLRLTNVGFKHNFFDRQLTIKKQQIVYSEPPN